jgi:adenosylmethionine-8-amino-7-oxononanoate aminotransferase
MSDHNPLMHTFPVAPPQELITHGEGPYLYNKQGTKYLDFTSGSTQCCVLGYSHPDVIQAMKAQIDNICYIDYKFWRDDNREELAALLLSQAEHHLDRVFFTGQSGSEACEAAMKLSYQCHQDSGKTEKTWFISRQQSYHGATLDSLSLGDRPNLAFFSKLLPKHRAKISPHHPRYFQAPNETLDEYARRSAKELEDKILEIGPEKVCAFIGETIMGGLVGDVPPAPNYWKYIKAVCEKHDAHLIMDEIYCGTGTSGKIYCCDWDQAQPDFILLGKTLGAGYVPLSAVVTSSKIEAAIAQGQQRIGYSSTHQGHTLGVATALAVQKVIHDPNTLEHVRNVGSHMRTVIQDELGKHPFFYDVRGRGLRFSFEYKCPNQNQFGVEIQNRLKEEHCLLVSGKWHRISFTPPFVVTMVMADRVLDRFLKTFNDIAKDWK